MKTCTNYAGALFPSLHHRKEWLRHQENVAKPPKPTQPGWFSFVFSIGEPPRPRDQQMLRGILLIARPLHTFYHRRRSLQSL